MIADFHKLNRQKLLDVLDKNAVCVFTAYTGMQRSNDSAATFEQEANFWYLTGIEYADWQLVFTKERSWLVAPEIDTLHQVFESSLPFERAKEVSGVDEVITQDDAAKLFIQLAGEHQAVYSLGKDPRADHYDFYVNPAQRHLSRQLKRDFGAVKECRRELTRLRAIKQPSEIQALRKAIDVTVRTFKSAKKALPGSSHEYEVEAEFTYLFRKSGATGHAYDPIVAGGKNACTLHYGQNSAALGQGSLLLIDIGARVDGYAADITRTYAVGAPTDRQVAVHAAVEAAHKKCIALLGPGVSVAQYHEAVDVIMQDALIELGLMQSRGDTKTYRTYFPHAISHGLGIDVHDGLGGPEKFVPGMVLTVEPGIYIPKEGIGVRIEDDILITPTGNENLSQALPTSL
jgi:Xaa-Pro aminopeptidase